MHQPTGRILSEQELTAFARKRAMTLAELLKQKDEFNLNEFEKINEDTKLTDKQKETNQVSKYDNRSELGKIFTGNRKERRKAMKEAKMFKKRSPK